MEATKIQAKIFKAYDIRGTYPEELNEEAAYLIGKGFAEFLNPKKVVVGRDMRLSSPALFNFITKGLIEQGVDVIDIGVSTTPLLYFSVIKFNADGGIQVTASHNPKQFNGFKMVREKAIPISGETGLQEIQTLAADNKFKKVTKKGSITNEDIVEEYVLDSLSRANPNNIKPFKIVVDAGNATGGIVMSRLFKHLKCTLIPLFFELDGSFPNHQPDPLTAENLEDIKNYVISEKADLGIAIDGDADRIVFIDEEGNPVPGDLTTAIVARIVLKKNPKATVLYDLRSSWIAKEEIAAAGGNPVMCKVGHSLIKKQMREENAAFAGELSSHFYFKEAGFIEAPLITTLYLLELMSKEGKLSSIAKPLRKYFQSGEINSEVKDKNAKMKEIESRFKDAKRVYWLDGLSIEYEDWWFNLRPSNTENLLRLNLEAKNKKKMEEMRDKLLAIIRK